MRLVISAQTRLFTGITASLIGYLALQHSTSYAATRTRIAGTLWPTVDEDRARHLLSNALYRLRQQLGTAATHLVVTNETIALQDVWVDVTQFRQLGMETAVSEWQAAINLYTGDLLEELDHSWLLTLRAELQEQYLALLHRTCDALVTQNRTTDALLVAHRWTVADPLNETAHVNMIQLYAQLGRFAAAQHQYQTLVTLLTEELGLSPLPATTELVFSIQKERQHTDRQQQATQSHFIGRKQERAALITQLDQLLHARGGLIFVEGEPGMGKTRLVEELNAAATWRKINVAWGRANEMDASEWGTPLPAALQAATAGPRLHQLMPELTTTVRQLLAPFIPRLRTGDKTLLDFRNTSTSPKMQITIAIQKLLQALTQRVPTLLIFDDVQWANTSFWQMLPGMMAVAQERPLLILLSYRSQTMQQDKIGWAMLQQLDQEHVPLRLELTGWDIAKCAELAAMQGKNLADADVTHLHRLSNGNPLVLNELLLHDGAHSPTFEALLSDRVSRLSANERGALTAVSVLGREFTHPIWQAMMDDPVPVTALLHQRFLTETMHGYSFQHDLVRAYLYQTLSPAQQQHWHQKAGDALAVAGTTNATLAWHYERAEQWGQAIHYHQHAVKRALLLGNYQAAREHNGRSLTLLTHHKIDEAEQ
ncbi:MAG: AAA family ATPase, partial [Chloroflexi bacterium]|nr:AAA family ATPase [Chloroflexota bacterium]